MKHLPRNTLKHKYPRYHYNRLGKVKQSFDSIELALKYLTKMNLLDYTIYLCQYCDKYHIAH